jgi:hypothetical protein
MFASRQRLSDFVKAQRLILALLAAGLVARVGIALAIGDAFQFPDEAVYADAAHRLIAGRGFEITYTRVPAYPMFLAALVGPFASSVLLLRVAQSVVTAMGAALVYALTSRRIGRGPALAAASFYAFDPLLVASAGLLYPEAIAAVLMIAIAFASLRAADEDRLDLAALAGLLLGFLIQLRPVALILAPVLVVWICVSTLTARSRGLLHAGVLILVCFLSLLPWTYRNYRVYGQLMPVATAGTRAAPVTTSELESRGLTASIIRKAWSEPWEFAVRAGSEFLHFWEIHPTRLATDDPMLRTKMRTKEPRLSAVPLFGVSLRDTLSAISFACEGILALLGIALAWKTHRRETVLILMLILAFAVGYTMFIAKLRYRIPVLPLLFIFAGVGANAVWTAAAGRRRARAPEVASA